MIISILLFLIKYPPWVRPGVQLKFLKKQGTHWLQMQQVNHVPAAVFFFPLQDLLVPISPSSPRYLRAPISAATTNPLGSQQDQRRSRAAIAGEAKQRHGETPRAARPTLKLLWDVMGKNGDGGNGTFSKVAAVRALFHCYADEKLAREWLQAPAVNGHEGFEKTSSFLVLEGSN